MATATLAQENIWFDKATYDKVEREYFERITTAIHGPMAHKTMDMDNNAQCLLPANDNPSTSKSKSKDNKAVAMNNELSQMKQSKSKGGKASKKNDANLLKIESLGEKEKEKEKESNCKCTVKEAKEKKNQAGTRHRNRGKVQSPVKEETEHLTAQVQTTDESVG